MPYSKSNPIVIGLVSRSTIVGRYSLFHEEMVRSYQHCVEVADPPPNPLSGDIVEE
jgi:hypothetical protein